MINDNESESDNDEFDCSKLWQSTQAEENFRIQPRDTSGKFLVACKIMESLMDTTKEKIILVSYSTKVFSHFILLILISEHSSKRRTKKTPIPTILDARSFWRSLH